MGKIFEQNADASISDLEEKVRRLEQERDAAIGQVENLQAALPEKGAEVQPESSEQEGDGSARLILESILKNVPDGLAISDLSGRVTYCSQEGIYMSGMSPEEMAGSTPEKRKLGMTLYKPDGTAPADLDEMPLVQVLRTGNPVRNRELLIRHGDGKEIPIRSNAAPIRDKEGNLIGAIHVWRDISKPKRAEKALAESEERYRTLFTNMTEGFALGEPILDGEGRPKDFRFLEINKAFEKYSGLSTKILGQPASVALPKLESYWIEIYCNVAMGGESVRFEQFNQDTNRWFDVYCFRPTEGRFAIFFRDVTDQRRMQERLSKSEERLKVALEASQMGVWELNLGDMSTTRTLEHDRIFGYEDLLPKWTYEIFLEHVLPEHREEVDKTFQTAISTGRPWHFECRIRRIDGQNRWIEARGRIYSDETGKTHRMVGIVADITSRKRGEEALRVSEERFRVAVKNSAFIPAQMDKDLRYLWIYNPHPDFDASAVIGKRDLEIEDSAGAHALQELKQRVLTSGCGESETIEFQRSDGVRIYDFIIEPLYDSSGKVDGLTSAAFDVTEKKRAEEELKKAKTAAEEASRAKSEFLANMSHEIRTPMTAFMTAIEHLQGIEEDPEHLRILDMADLAAKRLRSLIEEVLDFSRIEAGKVDIKEEPFDLRSCIDDITQIFTLSASDKNLHFETQIAGQINPILLGDSDKLGQVLINLIGNAVKFTHQGDVRLRVIPRDGLLEFSISDTGIGIPEDKQGTLFESFTQVDSSFNRSYGGTGLGLAISKGLVELMGGEIWVRSREAEGSVFSFTIPLKTAAGQQDTAATVPLEEFSDTSPAPILLAEDDPMIREAISLMLQQRGWRTEGVGTGREALERWRKGDLPLILMDLQMPEMNGIEATQVIRKEGPEETGHCCIIGLTAHALPEVLEECLAAGMDEVLTKPVQMNDLLSVIERCLQPKT
ncbi:MAG: PAS domain S-box protein [Desulfuromonadales bacterium]